MESLRYPIGKFKYGGEPDDTQRSRWIDDISTTPSRVQKAIANLNMKQLDTPYRPGGWTVRQVVHHLADSHLNAYIRFKLTVTEDIPTIKPYDEKIWAELTDAKTLPPGTSVVLLEQLHVRWCSMLRSMNKHDFRRMFHHPEHGTNMSLYEILGYYAWHGRHHVAHITTLREREGW